MCIIRHRTIYCNLHGFDNYGAVARFRGHFSIVNQKNWIFTLQSLGGEGINLLSCIT